jgi:hypothetical protein
MKGKSKAALAAVAVLAIAPAAANAAQQPTRTQRKIFRIVQRLETQTATVSTLNLGAAIAEAALAPCVKDIGNPMMPQGVNGDLSAEMGLEWSHDTLWSTATIEVNADQALLAIRSLAPSYRAQLQGEIATFSQVATLNTCADDAAWKAAGYAPSAEPANTRWAPTFQNNLIVVPSPRPRAPSGGVAENVVSKLTRKQRHQLIPLMIDAQRNRIVVATAVSQAFSIWINQIAQGP